MRILWLVPLLVPTVARAQDTSGFAELRATYDIGATGTPWQLVERVRPTAQVKLSPRVLVLATVEASLSEGRDTQTEVQDAIDGSDVGTLLVREGCSWPANATNSTFQINRASDYLSVERLYVDAYTKHADVRIGRQAIYWGSALQVHPTDPFPEVLFLTPWKPRKGTNAAPITIPFGEADAVQGVLGVDDTLRYPRAALRTTLNKWGTDFSLVGAYRGEVKNGIVGVDIRGTLGVGYWFEGSVHLAKDTSAYEEFAVGADYSFDVLQTWLIQVQYYHNGGGSSDPGDYNTQGRASAGITPPTCTDPSLSAVLSSTGDPFAPFFLGADYAFLATSLKITEDLSVTAVGVQNLDDGTGVAVPTVEYDATGSWSIAISAQLPYKAWGQGGEFKPTNAQLTLLVPTPPLGYASADLSGLVPDATVTAWTRFNF